MLSIQFVCNEKPQEVMIMGKLVMGIKVNQRQETAKALQDVLTKNGCIINTRLGFHDASTDSCSEQGYILLEFVTGTEAEAMAMKAEIEAIGGMNVATMEL